MTLRTEIEAIDRWEDTNGEVNSSNCSECLVLEMLLLFQKTDI